ncbi:hypothetical protein Scep_006252 [Stephania cephalantha]|uniref:PRONE domain-containing protein n=1 Tax=Stephania cephalantha TaxID=152367 RepID=A0AAP0KAB5_9MAGN
MENFSNTSGTDQSITDSSGYSPLSFDDSFGYCRTSSGTSAFSEQTEENSYTDESPSCLRIVNEGKRSHAVLSRLGMKQHADIIREKPGRDQEDIDAEMEMMMERFSKLLLGEDMSGSGKGVCTAVAISNAITNLYGIFPIPRLLEMLKLIDTFVFVSTEYLMFVLAATVFGQHLRLEPPPPEKKSMWKREMACLLSVCDYIVEFIPSSENIDDKTTVEVMTSRPRSDIYMNLPALQKLDNMLLEILDSFRDTEFWYAEEGSLITNKTKSGSFRRVVSRKEEKWWLPVPCVPPGGISEKSRKQLQHKRDCANQIHKAALTINNIILADMEIPDSYMETLPKSGKACLGDSTYRNMTTTEKFSPDHLLDGLNITSEHEALDIADRVEASMYTWRRKVCISYSTSSWDTVKDLMADDEKNDKNYMLAGRAESLLFSLKQRYPELSQTTLDTSKIQYNKDVGQAILESYSRVLEGLAFNIVAWIDDALYVDSFAKHQKQ